jgi:hypothetical protein
MGEGGGGGGRRSPWQRRKRESDGEEGGSPSSSSFTAAADSRGRTATSDEDDQQRFTAGMLLASTQWECASDLHRGQDATFRRRVDGLLATNRARGNGMGGDGGDDVNSGAPIKNYVRRSISGKGRNQERRKRRIEGRGRAIGRLVKTEISAADANPPPPPKNVDRLISEYVDRLRYIR